MHKTGLLIFVFGACLVSPGCGPPDRTVRTDQTPATAPAPLPERAKLPLVKLTPALERPVNAPDAEKLPQRAAEIVTRAEGHLAGGNYTRAVALLERARGFAPASARIDRGLGLAYAALGDRAKAVPHLQACARSAPDNVRVQLLLARYAAMKRRSDQAMIHLRTALLCNDAADENPDTAEALLRLASLLDRRGYWTAALDCHRRLAGLIAAHGRRYLKRPLLRSVVTRPEQCMAARGGLLLKLRKTDEAAVLLDRAYRRDKTYRPAGRLAVAALLQTGDFERSRAIVMEMLAGGLRRAETIDLAVRWCRAKKDPAAPQALLARHFAAGGADSTFVLAMAEVTAELGQAEAAAEMLSRYASKAPKDAAVAIRLARLYARAGNLPPAGRLFAAALAADAAKTSQVRLEIADLAPRPMTKDFAADVQACLNDLRKAAASEKAEHKPALLCVSAMLAEAVGQRDEAISLLQQAIRADDKFWPAYEVLEGLYVAGKDFESLDELIRRVNRAAADTCFRFYFIGKSQLDRGKVSDAVGNLEQARARDARHVPTLLLLGRAYVRVGKFGDAERHLLVAFGFAGDSIAVVRELYDLYTKQRRYRQAGRVLARFLQTNPGNIRARVLLGRLYFLNNQTLKARATLRELLDRASDNVEVRLLELLFYLPEPLPEEPIPAGQAASAFRKIRDVLRLDPEDVRAVRLQAALLANQGRHAEAARVFQTLHRRMPDDVRTASAWLDALIEAGLEKQAAAAVEEISRRQTTSTAMRMVMLDSLVRIKRYGQAEKLVEQWLESPASKTELTLLRFRAIKVYKAAEHYDKAQGLLDRWIASGPEPILLASLRSEKLRIFGLAKRYDEAVACAEKWIRDEPTGGEPRNILIEVLMEAEEYERAHAVVDEWIRKGGDPQMMDGLRVVKLLLFGRQGRFDQLLRFGREWIARDGVSAEPHRALVSVLAKHKKFDQAQKVAEDWLARRGKLPPAAPRRTERLFRARSLLVEVMLLAGRKQQALARARSFVQAEPEQVHALRILNAVLSSLGRDQEVLETSEKIYRLNPDDPGANNDLGYIWANLGIKLREAEAMIRKALATRPGEIAFKDSFGWVLYKQGRFAEAKTVFDQVLSADDEQIHPIILDHAGDTCWRLGLKVEAIRLWSRAVDKAKAEEQTVGETKKVLKGTPRKIKAGRRGGKPPLAPLGKGVGEGD